MTMRKTDLDPSLAFTALLDRGALDGLTTAEGDALRGELLAAWYAQGEVRDFYAFTGQWLEGRAARRGAAVSGRTPPEVVITRDDQDALGPILGGEYMQALRQRDRDAWAHVGDLITRAFAAGKRRPVAGPYVPPPRCVAHGREACPACSIGARDCDQCLSGPETGMHWDTCPTRVRTHPDRLPARWPPGIAHLADM